MRTLTLFLCVCSLKAQIPPPDRTEIYILDAIADQESGHLQNPVLAVGDRGRARGMYQMHRSAWEDALNELQKIKIPVQNSVQNYLWANWRNANTQKIVALVHIRKIKAQLRSIGVRDSAANVALVWNKGFRKAQLTHFRLNDYASRVDNIVYARTISELREKSKH
jgi:hypothetical protein